MMVHDFGRTLETFSKADAVNGLNVVESASRRMFDSWQKINPAIVEQACIEYLESRNYNIIRIT